MSVKNELSKSTKSLFGPSRLRYYYSELQQKQKEGHLVSPIDMWGLIIENAIYGKVWFPVDKKIKLWSILLLELYGLYF